MARRPRSFGEGFYHLASHASDTRHLFLSEDDRTSFLERLGLVLERFELRLVAYVLMGSHYHLLLFTLDGRVSRALQQLHSGYSRWHNARRGRSAQLFRAHPLARAIESEPDLVGVCRYLAYNPVEAGLASHTFSWRWGSARASAGLSASPVPLDEGPLRAAFGESPDWRKRYRAFIEDVHEACQRQSRRPDSNRGPLHYE